MHGIQLIWRRELLTLWPETDCGFCLGGVIEVTRHNGICPEIELPVHFWTAFKGQVFCTRGRHDILECCTGGPTQFWHISEVASPSGNSIKPAPCRVGKMLYTPELWRLQNCSNRTGRTVKYNSSRLASSDLATSILGSRTIPSCRYVCMYV